MNKGPRAEKTQPMKGTTEDGLAGLDPKEGEGPR